MSKSPREYISEIEGLESLIEKIVSFKPINNFNKRILDKQRYDLQNQYLKLTGHYYLPKGRWDKYI